MKTPIKSSRISFFESLLKRLRLEDALRPQRCHNSINYIVVEAQTAEVRMTIIKGTNIADKINFGQLLELSALAVMTKTTNNCLIRFARSER